MAHHTWIKAEKRSPLVTGEAIAVKAVQASSSDPNAQAANLINPGSLRDRDLDGLEEQSGDARYMWLSAQGDTKSWVEFDFGTPQKLSTICLWNYNDTWHTDRGVRTANISVWTQEGGWKTIRTDLPFEQAEGGDGYDEPTVVTLDAVPAQKVRLDNFTGLGDTECLGLSNVQFFQPRGPQAARPSPHDGATGSGVAGVELAWLAGEGATAHNVYAGTDPENLKLLGKVEQPGVKLSNVQNNTRYCWRVDEVQADGSVAAGRVWSFTTGGLVGWWKLDEAEGTKVADSSGSGHDGAIHGDPQWQPAGGRVGGALQFDGVDDYVDTGWASVLPVWTVAVWVKSPAPPAAPVASGPVHGEKNFQINWNHGADPVRGAAAVCVGGTWHGAGFGALQADTWYHLVATYDGENLKAYKDGVLITDKADPSGDADAESATLKFGRHATADNAFFAGTIDDVSVFAYALSAEEIKSLYSGRLPSAIGVSSSPAEPRLVRLGAEATNPSPLDGTTGAGTGDLELTWSSGDGAQAHNVYVGTGPDDLKLLGTVPQTSARLSSLQGSSQYWWRIDEVQADGSTIPSRVWSFTTGGLLAWWKLDESAGQDVADSAPHGHAGTLVGNVKWQPVGGRVGGALEFDGSGSYVRIGDEMPFDTINEITVAAWVKVRTFDKKWQTIIAKGDNTWRLAREADSNSVQFTAGRVVEGRIVLGKSNINDGQWHHLVGVGDANAVYLYVDGVLDNVKRTPGTMKPDNEPVYIGENSEQPARGRFWNGWIDEVCIFTHALRAEEVKALYSGTAPTTLTAQASSTGPCLVQVAPGAAIEPAGSPKPTFALQTPQVRAAGTAPQAAAQPPAQVKLNLWVVLVIVAVAVIAGTLVLVGKEQSP